jgi:hypothetical protein
MHWFVFKKNNLKCFIFIVIFIVFLFLNHKMKELGISSKADNQV